MKEQTLTCPYCGGTVPAETTICPDCQEDLSALIRLEYGAAIYYNEGLALAREGKLDEAVDKLRVALELQGDFRPAHLLLAKVEAQQKRWAQAKAHAAKAVELAPEDIAAQELLAEIERAETMAVLGEQERRRAAEQARQEAAGRYWANYKRDLLRAFGAGAGLMGLLAWILARALKER